MKLLYQFLIFPGFLFTAAAGLLASWIDRKVTARVQWRVGPPWYQPFADIMKLLGKETIIPRTASRATFLMAPIIGLAAVTLVSTFLWTMNISPGTGFIGDFIVIIYLLSIPSVAIVIGGFASGNPIASLGASREMKLFLGFELPFVLAMLVPVLKSGGSIKIGELLLFQASNGAFATSLSGVLALMVVIIAMQAKLGLVPFDVAEAETEIMGGAFVEYSGSPLAVFKLTKIMMLFTLPVFVVVMFMGGINVNAGIGALVWGILKYVLLLVLIVVIRNTSPRVRVDQAVRFFWGKATVLAVISVVLAFLGM